MAEFLGDTGNLDDHEDAGGGQSIVKIISLMDDLDIRQKRLPQLTEHQVGQLQQYYRKIFADFGVVLEPIEVEIVEEVEVSVPTIGLDAERTAWGRGEIESGRAVGHEAKVEQKKVRKKIVRRDRGGYGY